MKALGKNLNIFIPPLSELHILHSWISFTGCLTRVHKTSYFNRRSVGSLRRLNIISSSYSSYWSLGMRRTDLPTGPHSPLHQLCGRPVRDAELVHCLQESRNSLTVCDSASFITVILYSILSPIWHTLDPHVSKADVTPETSFKCMPQWTAKRRPNPDIPTVFVYRNLWRYI